MNPSTRASILAVLVAAVLASGTALLAPAAFAADGGKNLKVLPASMSKADIKKLMKAQTSALGVQCDFCHDTEDFPKDTEKKEIGRAMMRMTAALNKEYFKGEPKVGCITCHNGQKEPKHPPKL